MKINFISFICASSIALKIINPVFSSEVICDGTNKNPCIVQDTDTENHINDLRNWRDAQMMSENFDGNTTGLKDQWISGSAAPSEVGFKTILENVQKRTNGKAKKIIIIDLRQESHGYLNGDAIELNGENNWINRNKTNAKALADEQAWLNSLKDKKSISNVLMKAQFKAKNFSHGKTVIVKSVFNEKDLTTNLGFEYYRLMLTDHLTPRPSEVSAFVSLVKNIPLDTWIHLHCRAGKGRTTTFMVMYDILKNGDKVSFDDIIKRQSSVAPYTDFSRPSKTDDERERYEFLKSFYEKTRISFRN